jgi:hypothetical protein
LNHEMYEGTGSRTIMHGGTVRRYHRRMSQLRKTVQNPNRIFLKLPSSRPAAFLPDRVPFAAAGNKGKRHGA